MSKTGFSYCLNSDSQYEFLTADISYQGSFVAKLTREGNPRKFELVFQNNIGEFAVSNIPAEGFIEAISVAKDALLERK